MRTNRWLWMLALSAAAGLAGLAGAYLWQWSRQPPGYVATDPRDAIADIIDLGDIDIPPPGTNPVSLAEMHIPGEQPITIKGRVLAEASSNRQPMLVLISFRGVQANPQSAALASYATWAQQTDDGAEFSAPFHFTEQDTGTLALRIEWLDSKSGEKRLIAQGSAKVIPSASKATH
jgi:hypothetical protein